MNYICIVFVTYRYAINTYIHILKNILRVDISRRDMRSYLNNTYMTLHTVSPRVFDEIWHILKKLIKKWNMQQKC